MLKLDIVKESDSGIFVPHGTVVHAGSTYEVSVTAREFASHRDDSASLRIVMDGRIVASCDPLAADPLRRTRRTGVMSTGPVSGDAVMCARLGDSVLFTHPVRIAASDAGDAGAEQSGSRWATVDLGTLETGFVSVSDLTQVRLSASSVADSLRISAPTGPFEAYVTVVGTNGAFPFEGVLVNGEEPVWDHMDSLGMPGELWTIRLSGVSGTVHADLRAGRPPGAELDVDGDAVVSMEVNK